MAPLSSLLQSGELSQSGFCALYVLTYLSIRYPGMWLGSKKDSAQVSELNLPWRNFLGELEPNVRRRLEMVETVGEIFANFALKSTPLTVNRSLLAWDRREYGLELMFRIPSPREVLAQQKRGRRCVTVLLDPQKTRDYVLGERDALSFTMHDLIHADHFFHCNDLFRGQISFYGLLDRCLAEDHFRELYSHAGFMKEFDYVTSDMNAYPIHLLKCLKAAIVFHHPQKAAFFAAWARRVSSSAEARESLLALNSEGYDPRVRDGILLEWLEDFTYVDERPGPT